MSRADPAPALADLAPFRRALQAQGPRRGYLFYGPPEYFHRLALDVLKSHYGPERYEVHFVPSKKAGRADERSSACGPFQEAGEAASGAPFAPQMAGRKQQRAGKEKGTLPVRRLVAELVSPGLVEEPKLVIFLDAAPILEPAADALIEALAGCGPGTLAVSTTATKVPARLLKAFQQYGEVAKTRPPYERPGPWTRLPPEKGELAGWVVTRARDRGKKLAPAAAWELVERVGTDLAELDGEVEKLSLLAPGAEIGREELRAAVSSHRTYQVFELSEAILAGDRDRALRVARRAVLESAEEPEGTLLVLLVVLRREVRRLLAAAELAPPGGLPSPGRVAEALEVKEWQARPIVERLARLGGAAGALRAGRALYEAERDAKQGRAPAAWLLERLTFDLCGGQSRA